MFSFHKPIWNSSVDFNNNFLLLDMLSASWPIGGRGLLLFFFFVCFTRLMQSILLLCAHSAGKVLLWGKEEPTLFTWITKTNHPLTLSERSQKHQNSYVSRNNRYIFFFYMGPHRPPLFGEKCYFLNLCNFLCKPLVFFGLLLVCTGWSLLEEMNSKCFVSNTMT